ncbi:tRNA (cytosine(34)-C(5))-methyltransferase, mitochondrial [Rana temporaria]|uniref:tRNA (cytosine(34)-C(5))-methyltransferase, mitochondrial n=1 Tax=Rana temporaria TaxID=8407 RepID=UPI001AADC20D|nr:tRNA (cytosine(34)-C(5))-methyltransferase, mitochondrial [Rana temporaria]
MGRFRKQICRFVLDYFDQAYSKELGDHWHAVREVLTDPGLWQYAVLLNNYQNTVETENHLLMLGYHRLSSDNFSNNQKLMKCYISKKPGKFPSQRHQSGKIKDYYILNASSLLPVLALDIKDGEMVLDMCAAPGGKSVTLLQCASPELLHCNEPDVHRSMWLRKTLESFVPLSHMNVLSTTQLDGRLIGKLYASSYDKVLVDAPCSNDRSWLFSSDTERAKSRISERKILPVIQTELLRSAINALRPGGTLVYSTCTLSKAENSDVISDVLNSCSDVTSLDLSHLAKTLSNEFRFAEQVPHGLLVLPDKGKSWGPMFVSKLIKI